MPSMAGDRHVLGAIKQPSLSQRWLAHFDADALQQPSETEVLAYRQAIYEAAIRQLREDKAKEFARLTAEADQRALDATHPWPDFIVAERRNAGLPALAAQDAPQATNDALAELVGSQAEIAPLKSS